MKRTKKAFGFVNTYNERLFIAIDRNAEAKKQFKRKPYTAQKKEEKNEHDS